MLKVVLDTNVWVSAWLWGGVPSRILLLCKSRRLTIFASEVLLGEIKGVLSRPKFRKVLERLDGNVEQLMLATRQLVTICPNLMITCPQLRDPDDLIVLGAAQAAQVEVIVTGDKDLLVLANFEGIEILSPQGFLDCYLFQE
jgi:putative PIN family toxin of toxin-antitoxin system